MSTQLSIAVDAAQIVAAYKTSGIDKIVSSVEAAAKAEAEQHDPSTEKGRKNIASVAYQVARSKSAIDDQGKQLGEDYRQAITALNSDRKKARDSFDRIRDEIRKPVTDYEQREKNRIAKHENSLEFIQAAGDELEELTDEALNKAYDEVEKMFNERDWEEFSQRASDTMELTSNRISQEITRRKEAAAKIQAEKARAEAEAKRIQKEREERLVKEAAEKAKREAEEKAEAELKKLEAQRQAERDEVARKESEAKAKADAAKAKVEAELKAQLEKAKEADRKAKEAKEAEAKEKARIEAEEAKRKADADHIRKIKNEVFEDLCALNLEFNGQKLTVGTGREIITAISEGKIRHVSIHI